MYYTPTARSKAVTIKLYKSILVIGELMKCTVRFSVLSLRLCELVLEIATAGVYLANGITLRSAFITKHASVRKNASE